MIEGSTDQGNSSWHLVPDSRKNLTADHRSTSQCDPVSNLETDRTRHRQHSDCTQRSARGEVLICRQLGSISTVLSDPLSIVLRNARSDSAAWDAGGEAEGREERCNPHIVCHRSFHCKPRRTNALTGANHPASKVHKEHTGQCSRQRGTDDFVVRPWIGREILAGGCDGWMPK
jgi:hypothetical protein